MDIETIWKKIRDYQDDYEFAIPTGSTQDNLRIAYGLDILRQLKTIFSPYRDLVPLSTKQESDLADTLTRFLSNNALLIKSYTTNPTLDINLLIYDVAQYLADIKKSDDVMSLLMPMTACDTRDVTAVQTQVLSHDGLTLIPIRVLTHWPITAESIVGVHHAEKSRLIAHSALTQTIGTLQQDYQHITEAQDNLFTQLHYLCQQLKNHCIQRTVYGDNHALDRASQAIDSFLAYFNALTTADRNNLPANFLLAIQQIQTPPAIGYLDDLSAHSVAFDSAYDILPIYAVLSYYLEQHEDSLTLVSVGDAERSQLIIEIKHRYHDAQQTLAQTLRANQPMFGGDHVSPNQHLLQHFDLSQSFASPRDLAYLQAMTPPEITRLLQDEAIVQQFTTQLTTIDDLVMLSMALSAEQWMAFFASVHGELSTTVLQSPQDWVKFLLCVDYETCAAWPGTMQQHLLSAIHSIDDIAVIMRMLSNKKIALFSEALLDSALELTGSVKVFEQVMHAKHFTNSQKMLYLQAILNRLPSIIQSFDEFLRVKHFYSNNISVFYNVVLALLPTITQNSQQVSDIFYSALFNSPLRDAIYLVMKDKLLSVIQSERDFYRVTEYLSTAQYIEIFEEKKDEVVNYCKSLLDFKLITHKLPQTLRDNFFDKIKHRAGLISHVGDFQHLSALSAEERTFLYEKARTEATGACKSHYNYHDMVDIQTYIVASFFNIPDFAIPAYKGYAYFSFMLSDAIIATTPQVISKHFSELLKHLQHKDIKEFLEGINAFLPEQREYFYAKNKHLLAWIDSVPEFLRAKRTLTDPEFGCLCEALKNRFSELFTSSQDIAAVMAKLYLPERIIFYENIKFMLPDIIMAPQNFRELLRYTPHSEKLVLLHLPSLHRYLKTFLPLKAKPLALALMDHNAEQIKIEFDALIDRVLHPSTQSLTFLSKQVLPVDACLDAIAALDLFWTKKINEALALDLPEDQLASPAFKTALVQYINDINADNQTLTLS